MAPAKRSAPGRRFCSGSGADRSGLLLLTAASATEQKCRWRFAAAPGSHLGPGRGLVWDAWTLAMFWLSWSWLGRRGLPRSQAVTAWVLR